MRRRGILIAAVCTLITVNASLLLADDAKVPELLEKIPADGSAEGQKVLAEILALGPDGIKDVCNMLVPPGTGDDTKARFALSGLAMYVSRPDAEAERKMYAGVLIEAIESASDNEVKAFLICQLQLAGKDEAVPLLCKFLADDRLCDPATQALLAIRTPAAAAELVKALPAAKGKNLVTIMRALAELREKDVLDALIKHATSEDVDVRRTALYGIANIGDPSAREILSRAAQSSSPFERAIGTSCLLLFAQRLAEAGEKEQCAAICRDLTRTRTDPREKNVQCAALRVLVGALGKEALGDLLAALDNENKDIREAALDLACAIPGEDVTAKCVEKMKQSPPEVRAEVLSMLARRGDKAALPALLDALKDKDQAVRLAAIPAAARLGGGEALPALLAALQTDQAEEIKAVQEAIMRAPGDEAMAVAAAALPNVPPPSRVAILEVLAARRAASCVEAAFAATRDEDPTVRQAAIKAFGELAGEKDLPRLIDMILNAESSGERSAAQKAAASVAERIADPERRADCLLTALEKTTGESRGYLLQALARVGGQKALQTVVADTRSADAAIQDAAVRALSEWEDPAAAPELLNIALSSENLSHQVLALRGYVRLARAADLPPGKKVQMFKDALAAAKRPEEKKLALAGLAEVRTVESLKAAAACLDDESLQSEAALAVVKIACPKDRKDKGLTDPAAAPGLRKAIALIKDKKLRQQAEEHLSTLPIPDELNLAWNKPVKASVPYERDRKPELAVDGDSRDKNSAWFGKNWPAWLEIDLEKPVKIDSVHVYFFWDGKRYYQYTVEVSLDGKTWQMAADMSQNTAPSTSKGVMHNFPAVEARYVRVNVLKNSANQALHLMEVKVYAEGTAPKPPPPPKADAEGFVPLVYDSELTGWMGATKGYTFENGVLVCDEKTGGTILTEKEYRDFILRFEFKLPPDGNNGVAIRAPSSGSPTYNSMEIQIIDNTAEKHKNLKPYQYHGSIYGVVPAKREYLKPVGEWNSEEIVAQGPRITVNLNDTTIVDADISTIDTPMDGKDHPGLKRESGHVGFMGHGSRVEFRNIRIKELS